MVLEKVPSIVLLSSTELKKYSSKYNTIFSKHFNTLCATSPSPQPRTNTINQDPRNSGQLGTLFGNCNSSTTATTTSVNNNIKNSQGKRNICHFGTSSPRNNTCINESDTCLPPCNRQDSMISSTTGNTKSVNNKNLECDGQVNRLNERSACHKTLNNNTKNSHDAGADRTLSMKNNQQKDNNADENTSSNSTSSDTGEIIEVTKADRDATEETTKSSNIIIIEEKINLAEYEKDIIYIENSQEDLTDLVKASCYNVGTKEQQQYHQQQQQLRQQQQYANSFSIDNLTSCKAICVNNLEPESMEEKCSLSRSFSPSLSQPSSFTNTATLIMNEMPDCKEKNICSMPRCKQNCSIENLAHSIAINKNTIQKERSTESNMEMTKHKRTCYYSSCESVNETKITGPVFYLQGDHKRDCFCHSVTSQNEENCSKSTSPRLTKCRNKSSSENLFSDINLRHQNDNTRCHSVPLFEQQGLSRSNSRCCSTEKLEGKTRSVPVLTINPLHYFQDVPASPTLDYKKASLNNDTALSTKQFSTGKRARCSSMKHLREKPFNVCHMRRLSAPIKFQEFKTLRPATTRTPHSLQKSPFIFQQNNNGGVSPGQQQKRSTRKHSKTLRSTLRGDLTMCQRPKDPDNINRRQNKKARAKSLDSFEMNSPPEIPFQVKRVSKVTVDTLKTFSLSSTKIPDLNSRSQDSEKKENTNHSKNNICGKSCCEYNNNTANNNSNINNNIKNTDNDNNYNFNEVSNANTIVKDTNRNMRNNSNNTVISTSNVGRNNINSNSNTPQQLHSTQSCGNSTVHLKDETITAAGHFTQRENGVINPESGACKNNRERMCCHNAMTLDTMDSHQQGNARLENMTDENNNNHNNSITSKIDNNNKDDDRASADVCESFDSTCDAWNLTERSLLEAAEHIHKIELNNNQKNTRQQLTTQSEMTLKTTASDEEDDYSGSISPLCTNTTIDYNVDLRHHEKYIKNLENLNGVTMKNNRSSLIMLTSVATNCYQQRRKFSGSKGARERRKLSLDEIEQLTKSFAEKHVAVDGKKLQRRRSSVGDRSYRGHEQYSEYPKQKKNQNVNFPITLPDIPFTKSPINSASSTPQLTGRSSKSDESNDEDNIDMRILEQDLGSDADSLPSCGESLTASESPPNSPELFKPKLDTSNRRESAPASLNLEAIKDGIERNDCENDEDDLLRELHRRYSSVEERTNRVRFKLQESFQEEEDRYNKQFIEESEVDLQRKFSDIEGYKIPPKQYQRKVSSPPCLPSEIEESLPEQRKTSFDRSRKCSVYSDNSGSYQILPGQAVKRVASHDDLIVENDIKNDIDRKISLQDHKPILREKNSTDRKHSLQDAPRRRSLIIFDTRKDEQGNRKFSLQVQKRRPSFSDRKLSLQERQNAERKVSSADRKLSLNVPTDQQRKQSLAERKISQSDRKISSTDRKISLTERKISSSERKISSSERKHSSAERKLSQEIRKVSLSDTLRSVVGTKKKHERKPSHEGIADENNNLSNDKKSTWGLIKNKIKKDRKSSNDLLTNGSPRMLRLLSRHDSSSSVESGTPRRSRRSDSLSKRSPRSEDYDRKSISSFNSLDLEDSMNEPQQIVPKCAFDVWAEGKVDIDIENKTLPLLHVAAAEGNQDLLKTLLDVGVDVNEIDASGWPALHYAVCSGHFECAQLLLAKGATLQNYSNKVMNTYCSAIRDCIRIGGPNRR